jgi:hypothetical protein
MQPPRGEALRRSDRRGPVCLYLQQKAEPDSHGLVPAIHVLFCPTQTMSKTWVPGTSPGTGECRLPPAGRRPAQRLRRVLHDPPDLVGRPPAGLEIDARLHLGDDPEQQKEHPRQTNRRGEQGQRRLDQ